MVVFERALLATFRNDCGADLPSFAAALHHPRWRDFAQRMGVTSTFIETLRSTKAHRNKRAHPDIDFNNQAFVFDVLALAELPRCFNEVWRNIPEDVRKHSSS
jgi:hypothetical protein